MQENENIGSRLRQFRLSKEEDQSQFARKIEVSQQQLSKYENSYVEPSSKFYDKLCKVFPELNLRWLVTGEGEMLNTAGGCSQVTGDTVFIPYWDGCPNCADKLVKPTIKDGILIGTDVVVNDWNCDPKNLYIISMPGEDMDGGQYPIRNNDILVIDISKTNYSDSGVYLVTTHHGETVAVRRLVESLNNSIGFTVDNPTYAQLINKIVSKEDLEEMDFKVIGRVVKNVTYTL